MSFINNSLHLIQCPEICQNGSKSKESSGVRTDHQIVEDPRDKGQGYQKLKMDRILHFHKQNVDRTHDEGQIAQKSLIVKRNGQDTGKHDQKNLHRPGEDFPVAEVISDTGKNIADSTRNGP